MKKTVVTVIAALALFGVQQISGEEWFKGGLHLHTLWSDGDGAPGLAAAWYKEHGWNFICYTDHNILLEGDTYKPIAEDAALTPERVDALRQQFGEDWVETQEYLGRERMRLKTYDELKAHFEEPGSFLLIHGEEITTLGGSPHVNAINVVERTGGLPPGDIAHLIRQYMQAVTDQAEKHKQPMLSFLCHPNWSDAVTVEEALEVPSLRFFEVYNGHPSVNNWGHEEHGYPSTDRFWDVLLSMRLRDDPSYTLYGLATDDAHDYHTMGRGANPGRGWVMVRADTLAVEPLIAAIKRGDFYASTGVSLDSVNRDATGLSFSILAEPGVTYTTQFIGTRRGFNTDSEPLLDDEGTPKPRASRQYSDGIGMVLAETTETEPAYVFAGDELYVRAKIISDKAHPNPFKDGDYEMAWTQPAIAP